MTQLSAHDSAVLSALLDTEPSPPSTSDPSLSSISDTPTTTPPPPLLLPHISPAILPTLRAREADAIRPLNRPSPTASAIEAAIEDLSSLISAHPTYAPAYLNRAQATRLRLDSSFLWSPSSVTSAATTRASPSEFFSITTLASTTQLL